jgi:hypothetical protein
MFEIIPVSEVRVSPRGRKTTYNEDLIKALKTLKAGQAVNLGGLYGNVAKKDRASVAQSIRKHWNAAREDGCRIDWDSQTGFAQIQAKASK